MTYPNPVFRLHTTSGAARAGVLHTPRRDVPTPLFMPVATQGSVKAVDPTDLRDVGANIVLGNTYHLCLRPGVDLLEDLGGLHAFMRWDGPILTDSGGFQGFSLEHLRKIDDDGILFKSHTPMRWDGPILTDSGGFQGFSLEHLRKIDDDGILFKSHIDGSPHKFTPESTVHAQERIGADIIMPLDMCVAADASREEVERALERTTRWETRCRQAHTREDQLLFGIVQGGMFEDLRRRSVAEIVALDFPGYAIGGLSVGESKPEMYGMTKLTAALLPVESPRYLMGVGSPEDLVEGVARGIDMFDCVLPTRIARNGALFSRDGTHQHLLRAPPRPRRSPRTRLRLLHLPRVLSRLRPPPVQVQRASRIPTRHDSQPALHPQNDGRDARRNPFRYIPRVPPSVPRPVHATRPASAQRAAPKMANRPGQTRSMTKNPSPLRACPVLDIGG